MGGENVQLHLFVTTMLQVDGGGWSMRRFNLFTPGETAFGGH